MDKLHCIHSQGGRIGDGTDTLPGDIDALVEALRRDGHGRLAIHFHGGLVSKSAGLTLAGRLGKEYEAAAYPVFYVWESGVWETIRNNLAELADEPVFRQLVRKLLQYALQRLGGQLGSRSVLPGTVDSRQVKQTVDAFWAQPSRATIPYRDFLPAAAGGGARSAMATVDEADIQADLESDTEFAAALATLPDIPPGTRSALSAPAAVEHRSNFSLALSAQLSERPGTRGLITWYKVAVLLKRVLVAVLGRYADGRDHGLYATVVEEIARAVKLGGSGLNEWAQALQWNRMKQDVRDAFGDDPQRHAGTALLQRLKTAIDGGLHLDRITLIGHSTGAIYIAHWLEAAERWLPPGVRFDVVYLAPAITYELFDRTLTQHGQRIRSFRMFAMSDAHEREDQVWGDDQALQGGDLRRFIYPSSLLYLVAGILECDVAADGSSSDAPDKPLLGMQRYFSDERVYDAVRFPEVGRVRAWLRADARRTVWSIVRDAAPGLNCAGIDHGGFDEDRDTLDSVRAIMA